MPNFKPHNIVIGKSVHLKIKTRNYFLIKKLRAYIFIIIRLHNTHRILK